MTFRVGDRVRLPDESTAEIMWPASRREDYGEVTRSQGFVGYRVRMDTGGTTLVAASDLTPAEEE